MDQKCKDLIDQMNQFESTFNLISDCLKECSIDFRNSEFNKGDKPCFSTCASTKSVAYKLWIRRDKPAPHGGL